MMLGIALLLVVTGIVAAVHLNNQTEVSCMVSLQGNQETAVSFRDLNQGAFSGELVDGKGDVTLHNYTGILLRDLLDLQNHITDLLFRFTNAALQDTCQRAGRY